MSLAAPQSACWEPQSQPKHGVAYPTSGSSLSHRLGFCIDLADLIRHRRPAESESVIISGIQLTMWVEIPQSLMDS